MLALDYRPLLDSDLQFEIDSATTACYNIGIILDSVAEGNEDFLVIIFSIPAERVYTNATTRVVIIDYSGGMADFPSSTTPLHTAPEPQQPQSLCAGLENLLNTTIPDNITCNTVTNNSSDSMDCDAVVCATSGRSFSLVPLPCNRSIQVTVTDGNGDLLTETFFSMEQDQVLHYNNEQDHLNISLNILYGNSTDYYIITLFSTPGLHLLETAIPIICPGMITRQVACVVICPISADGTYSVPSTVSSTLPPEQRLVPGSVVGKCISNAWYCIYPSL